MNNYEKNLALFSQRIKPICKICRERGVFYTADELTGCSECNTNFCSLHFSNHVHLH